MSVRNLAGLSQVDRATITRAEDDDPRVTELTYSRIERALDDWERETGADEEQPDSATPSAEQPAPANGPKLVKFTIHGVYGAAEVIVEGPVENMAELQEAVDKLLRGQHDKRNGIG